MQDILKQQPGKFGLAGFMLGSASMVIVLVQIAAFFKPEEKSVGTIIGEIAADIKMSAARALSGEAAPAALPPAVDYGHLFLTAALVIAGIAIILGGIGLYRKEPHRLCYLAVGFGVSALVMQYMFWLAVLICGIALMISIIENLSDIFDFG